MSNQRYVIQVTAGRLLWRSLRDYLEDAKFRGCKIEWREGRGFFERDFTIIAEEPWRSAIDRDLRRWFRQLEAK